MKQTLALLWNVLGHYRMRALVDKVKLEKEILRVKSNFSDKDEMFYTNQPKFLILVQKWTVTKSAEVFDGFIFNKNCKRIVQMKKCHQLEAFTKRDECKKQKPTKIPTL